jgi:hypothetical protein
MLLFGSRIFCTFGLYHYPPPNRRPARDIALPITKRALIIQLLREDNSIRGSARVADVAINSVVKTLIDVGISCREYQDKTLRNLKCKRIQLDEIWAFCYAKAKNVPQDKRGQLGYGDVWTWTALCADTKLMVSWLVGGRDAEYANAFVKDVAERVAGRIQVTSDGHAAYLEAVEGAFGAAVDYAQLVKIYGHSPESGEALQPGRMHRGEAYQDHGQAQP